MASEIKRPVEAQPAFRGWELVEPDGNRIARDLHGVVAREMEPCINLAPRAIELLRKARPFLDDAAASDECAGWRADAEQALGELDCLLAEWDARTKGDSSDAE